MSHNISYIKVIENNRFCIGVDKLFQTRDVYVQLVNYQDVVVNGVVENFEIEGKIDLPEGLLYVDKLSYGGCYSGTWYQNFLSILENSLGYIKIEEVWEDGEISLYSINDGEIEMHHVTLPEDKERIK